MKEVIAIVSRKGGSGKTTTAQAIGAALRAKGDRVLLVDLDSQMNLSKAMGADLNGLTTADLFEPDINSRHTIQHTDNGDIIAGSKDLAGADKAIQSNKEIKTALAPLLSGYDFIIIDTPASFGRLTANALTAATSALITVEAAPFSYDGVDDLLEVITQMKRANAALTIRGFIVTKYDGRSNEAKRNLNDFRAKAEEIGTSVIDPPIRATAKVCEAQGRRRNLNEYAPKSTAAQDYNSIADVIHNW